MEVRKESVRHEQGYLGTHAAGPGSFEDYGSVLRNQDADLFSMVCSAISFFQR